MPSVKKESAEPTRFSSRSREIEPEPVEVSAQSRGRKRAENIAIPTTEDEFTLEEEELNTPTVPEESSTPKMASDKDVSAMLSQILDRLTQLESGTKTDGQDRGARVVTLFNSAFGGKDFKPTGFAALPAFAPYGDDQNAANPKYDKKIRKTGLAPCVFDGDKTKYDKWIVKVADNFDEDSETFKKERSRMALLNSWLEGSANDLLEARYQSTENAFSSVAEMVAAWSAVYHDDNQGTKAREALHKLRPTLTWTILGCVRLRLCFLALKGLDR